MVLIRIVSFCTMLLLAAIQYSHSFNPAFTSRFKHEISLESSSTSSESDCGCGVASEFSGKPPMSEVREMNVRKVAGDVPIYNVDGNLTNINEILGTSNISLVVLLRSLG